MFPFQSELLQGTSHTSDSGWFCRIVDFTLTLTLSKPFYTECGLQCKKARDHVLSRDVYVFTCDLSGELSKHIRERLAYCFEHVLKHEYTWFFSSRGAVHKSQPRVSVPASIETVEDLQDVLENISGQLLEIEPGSHDSAVNTFVLEERSDYQLSWSHSNDCCATGTEISKYIDSLKDNIRFISLETLPGSSDCTKDITCFFSGSDDVYLLQYDIR